MSERVREENFNYQEIIHRGQEAARAVNSPILNMAYKSHIDDLTAQLLGCSATEDVKCKELRRQINATAQTFGVLIKWIRQAETVVAQQQQQHDAQGGPNEYQGFGIEEGA